MSFGSFMAGFIAGGVIALIGDRRVRIYMLKEKDYADNSVYAGESPDGDRSSSDSVGVSELEDKDKDAEKMKLNTAPSVDDKNVAQEYSVKLGYLNYPNDLHIKLEDEDNNNG